MVWGIVWVWEVWEVWEVWGAWVLRGGCLCAERSLQATASRGRGRGKGWGSGWGRAGSETWVPGKAGTGTGPPSAHRSREARPSYRRRPRARSLGSHLRRCLCAHQGDPRAYSCVICHISYVVCHVGWSVPLHCRRFTHIMRIGM
ncbi:hypothetical protein B484DRAFT_250900 [Ochromonadaceae sp. CCMP2298]|nr:hypothetical protein B484DRAFT_250900 [Ochromonadaceae sp. CCMP2298]